MIKKINSFIFTLILFIFPSIVFGAEIFFKSIQNVSTSDNNVIIEVRIDPQSKNLNVVEGVISFSGSASDDVIVQVENGQSILPLWPVTPIYIRDEKAIRFTGGVPGGFNSEGALFRILISSKREGDLILNFLQGSAYVNDGRGTKESITSGPIKIVFDINGKGWVVESLYGLNSFISVRMILLILVTLSILLYGYKLSYKK